MVRPGAFVRTLVLCGLALTALASAKSANDNTAVLVDPSHDCSFSHGDPCEQVDGTFHRNTRIGSFALSGDSGAVVTLAPTSLMWAKFSVGVTSKNFKKVTLTNSGTGTLTISTITITGDFALVPVLATKKVTPCVNGSTVAPGASCIARVSFEPTQSGLRTGNLTFTDDAPDSPQNVPLSGTGVGK